MFLERNKKLSDIVNSFKDRFDKAQRQVTQLDFKNVELTKTVRKLEEELEFYKQEAKEKFTLEVHIKELSDEVQGLQALKREAKSGSQQAKIMELEQECQNFQ